MSRLDEDKIKECKIVFDMFDKEKVGKIHIDNLEDVIRILGGAPSQEEMNEIIIGLNNKVRGGMVDFKKFLNILQNQLDTQDSENDLIQEFSKLDSEGKGKIKESDLRRLMSDYENALTNEEIEEIMLDADIDEDGYVDYVKFVKILIGG